MDTHIHPDPGNTEPGPLHVSLPEDVFDLERGKTDAGTAGRTAPRGRNQATAKPCAAAPAASPSRSCT